MLLTIPQAADRVGVLSATIRQWMHRGHLRTYPARVLGPDGKVRTQRLIMESELLLAERDTRRRGGRRTFWAGG